MGPLINRGRCGRMGDIARWTNGFLAAVLCLTALTASAGPVIPLNPGTIQTTTGTARMAGVLGVNQSSGTARVVIDAADKFGNKSRFFRTVGIAGGKIRAFGLWCVRNPTGCLASAAIVGGLAAVGISVLGDGEDAQYVKTQDGLIDCPSNYVAATKNTDGTHVMAWVGIPCIKNTTSNQFIHTRTSNQSLIDWSQDGEPYQEGTRWVATQPGGVAHQDYIYVFRAGYGANETQPDVLFQADPALAQEVLTDALAKGELQLEPGVYADIWEPVDLSDVTVPEEDFPTDPEPEPGQGLGGDPLEPDGTPIELIDPSDLIEQKTVDLSGFLSWGVGWLPASCPAPKKIWRDKYYDFSPACGIISDYIKPIIVVLAIFSFLTIVFRGIA